MKEMAKRTAAAALVGVMTMGMLAGCGETKLDGTKTVATVNGEEIPMGVLSILVREQQMATEQMYAMFMGSTGTAIWSSDAGDGKTYGEQTVEDALQMLELMYIMREKAADNGVEVTEEEQAAIAEAAAAFMAANSEETIAEVGITEEQAKLFLELETIYNKSYNVMIQDVDTEFTDEEIQKSGFTYVTVTKPTEEETTEETSEEVAEDSAEAVEEEEETTEETRTELEIAQEILDAMLADPTADMDEVAGSVSEDCNAYTGSFMRYESEDEEESDDSAYPEEVIAALRELEEGEVCAELVETDSYYYIVRLDSYVDEEATESRKESLLSTRESELFAEVSQQWLDEAEIEENEKVMATLIVSDTYKFITPTPVPEETTEEEAADEVVEEEAADETTEEVVEEETADDTAEEPVAEEETTEDTAEETEE